MRYFFLTLIIALSLQAKCQYEPMPVRDGEIKYSFVDSLGDTAINASNLFQRAEQWFVRYWKNPESVIQMRDPENHYILAKGTLAFSYKLQYNYTKEYVECDIKIECRKGRYRVQVYGFTLYNPRTIDVPERRYSYMSLPLDPKRKQLVLNKTDLIITDMLIDIRNTMRKTQSIENHRW